MVGDIINDQFEVIQQKQVYACGGGHTCAVCKENTEGALSRRNKGFKNAVAKLQHHPKPSCLISILSGG